MHDYSSENQSSVVKKKEWVVCTGCTYFKSTTFDASQLICLCNDAPPTDYILGIRDPYVMNKNGTCGYYKSKIKE